MSDICPKCGKDTFEITVVAPFETDPHQEGRCHNEGCGARGRMDILELQSEVKRLRALIETSVPSKSSKVSVAKTKQKV